VKSVLILALRQPRQFQLASVCLTHKNYICQFRNSSFNPLKFISPARLEDKDKSIGKLPGLMLRLANSDRFHKD
jgi:hypothetical protein